MNCQKLGELFAFRDRDFTCDCCLFKWMDISSTEEWVIVFVSHASWSLACRVATVGFMRLVHFSLVRSGEIYGYIGGDVDVPISLSSCTGSICLFPAQDSPTGVKWPYLELGVSDLNGAGDVPHYCEFPSTEVDA